MKKEKNKSNKFIKSIIASFFTMSAIFFIFFINTINVSAKTVNEEGTSSKTYILTLQERGGVKEQINGIDIDLNYNSQSPEVVTYNEALLKEHLNNLSCFDSSKIIESQNATVKYTDNGYVIMNEIYGNRINKDVLYEYVVKAIKNGDTTIDLESINCYEDPKYFANSPEVINAKDTLNKYVYSHITYDIAGITQVLDSSIIKDFLGVDYNYQVTIDESKVRNYVDNLANIYTTSLGTNIRVSGGYEGNNHSWVVDTASETQALIENIKGGQTITKQPMYAQTSTASYFSNVGDTYIEIDMNKQHLWYYKDGYLVVEGDVVTGNVSNGNSTPEGVYNLYYKQKDTVLRGPGYASPVSFWMPFNGGVGLHDASWRSEFGGDIYKTSGSHGCVNAPYYLAKAVYDNVSAGDTVICYN